MENNIFAHIVIERVVKCILENPHKTLKSCFNILINRTFAVRELTWLLQDIRVYNKKIPLSFYLKRKDAVPARNPE